MNWSDLSGLVAKAAPLIGSLLGGPAGGAVGALVARAVGAKPEPAAIAQAIEADPKALERIREMELSHQRELERMHLEAETARLAQINQTMRTEVASQDAYVRRWRPTFGYLVAIAWLAQSVAIAWMFAVKPAAAGTVAQAVTALTPMWGVALAVLGINVTSRSKDKQVAAGQTPPAGLLGALAERLRGSRDG